MPRRLALLLLALSATAAEAAEGRFRPLAVYVDSRSTPLAAYQVEIVLAGGAEIVGVEGGEPAAFRAAPYYDPAALKCGRIVLAAFHVGTDLPAGRQRVAALHVYEPSGTSPRYEVKLMVAAGADGAPIAAEATILPPEGDPR